MTKEVSPEEKETMLSGGKIQVVFLYPGFNSEEGLFSRRRNFLGIVLMRFIIWVEGEDFLWAFGLKKVCVNGWVLIFLWDDERIF